MRIEIIAYTIWFDVNLFETVLERILKIFLIQRM